MIPASMSLTNGISTWTDAEADYNANGMPHKTKIARKPEGVRAELKALVCCSTGIDLYMNIIFKTYNGFTTAFCNSKSLQS